MYEYRCDDCGKKFDFIATIAEKETGLHPVCPKCGAKDCRQVFGRVTVLTSSKSETFDDDLPDDSGDSDDLDMDDMTDSDSGTDDLDL
jgi:putative FmdB family regulatory protein